MCLGRVPAYWTAPRCMPFLEIGRSCSSIFINFIRYVHSLVDAELSSSTSTSGLPEYTP